MVTAHNEAISVLEEFADRVSGPGNTGTLDDRSFLAALIEWVLGSYSAVMKVLTPTSGSCFPARCWPGSWA